MTDLAELRRLMEADAMSLFEVVLPKAEVVFFKGLIEAYPGVAAVHATPRRDRPVPTDPALVGTCHLVVATTKGLEKELDEVLAELADEIAGMRWNALAFSRVEDTDGAGRCQDS